MKALGDGERTNDQSAKAGAAQMHAAAIPANVQVFMLHAPFVSVERLKAVRNICI